MFSTRYLFSTTCLLHEIRMWFLIILTHIQYRISSIFNYCIISINWLNWIPGMVTLILFLYIAHWNTWVLMWVILKLHYFIWQIMSGVRKLNIKASTIYLISIDLAKQYSYLFLLFTNQNGTHSILTKKIGLLSKN